MQKPLATSFIYFTLWLMWNCFFYFSLSTFVVGNQYRIKNVECCINKYELLRNDIAFDTLIDELQLNCLITGNVWNMIWTLQFMNYESKLAVGKFNWKQGTKKKYIKYFI